MESQIMITKWQTKGNKIVVIIPCWQFQSCDTRRISEASEVIHYLPYFRLSTVFRSFDERSLLSEQHLSSSHFRNHGIIPCHEAWDLRKHFRLSKLTAFCHTKWFKNKGLLDVLLERDNGLTIIHQKCHLRWFGLKIY